MWRTKDKFKTRNQDHWKGARGAKGTRFEVCKTNFCSINFKHLSGPPNIEQQKQK